MRGFHWLSKAYYAKNINRDCHDEIMIGDYCEDGGTSGEFAIRWMSVANKITPRLEAFDDSWKVLNDYADILPHLAKLDSSDPSPETVVGILKQCGFEDMTAYTFEDNSNE